MYFPSSPITNSHPSFLADPTRGQYALTIEHGHQPDARSPIRRGISQTTQLAGVQPSTPWCMTNTHSNSMRPDVSTQNIYIDVGESPTSVLKHQTNPINYNNDQGVPHRTIHSDTQPSTNMRREIPNIDPKLSAANPQPQCTPSPSPLTPGERAKLRVQKPKKTRAHINIATLNMRGHHHQGIDKWMNINQILWNNKLGVLCLQETHLSRLDADDLTRFFGPQFEIACSQDPTQPNAGGVAIVVNSSNIVEGAKLTTYDLIPG